MKQRGAKVFIAVHFTARSHEHVCGHCQPAQTTLRALVAPDRPLVALRQNHHEVHVTVFIGRSPGVRAEEINFLRLKLGFQPFDYIFQKARLNGLHDAKANIPVADLKVRVRASIQARASLQKNLAESLESLWHLPAVGDIRQVGLIAGVELVRNWRTREPFPLSDRIGIRVCEAMARRGVLTRPVGNVIVLMPPYCTTSAQVRRTVAALGESVEEVCGAARLTVK
jgi:hypothetical protein